MIDKKFRSHENDILKVAVLCGDLFISNVLFWVFQYFFSTRHEDVSVLYQSMIAGSVLYLLCTMRNGVELYKPRVENHQIAMRVLSNMFKFVAVESVVFYFGLFFRYRLPAMILYWALMTAGIILFRFAAHYLVKKYRSISANTSRVILIGGYENNVRLYNTISGTPSIGCTVEGYFDDAPNDKIPEKCKYLGRPQEAIAYMKDHPDIHELYCCLPSKREDEITEIIRYCTNHLVHFYSVPNVSNYLHHRVYFNMLGDVPFLSLYRDPLMRPENRLIKRLFDIAFSLVFLCTLFPIIFIVVAIVTKITMPGPIFFRQKRNGINGKEFYCLKFRSMKVNAEADTLQATKNDPRKTRWGDILRKTNLDETPQFINVLLGDMSVVGPRPHMLKHTQEYAHLIDTYMMRHFAKPGITGWSQVTGFRGETKELSQMEGRIRGDIWYLENWSFWLDIYIIYKTVANAVMGDKAAY